MVRSIQKHGRADTASAGFTLVELLVVIGIIALLISILLPALNKARESANQVKCAANLHTIGLSMLMYVNDFKGFLPIGELVAGDSIGDPSIIYAGESTDWTVLLARELNRNAANSYAAAPTDLTNSVRTYFLCPSAPTNSSTTQFQLTDYSSNPRLIPDMGTLDGATTYVPPYTKSFLLPCKLARIRHSSDMVAIFDASLANSVGSWNAHVVANGLDNNGVNARTFMTDNYSLAPTLNAGTPIDVKSGGGTQAWGPAYYNTDSEQNLANIRFRHSGNKKANALMTDGHVQSFNYNPTSHQSDILEGNINVNQ
jgi:prepilin-type N-terminal cleavage/methylation domain-containing protein/prepilin-type processing-associated H-X9-DG protein